MFVALAKQQKKGGVPMCLATRCFQLKHTPEMVENTTQSPGASSIASTRLSS